MAVGGVNEKVRLVAQFDIEPFPKETEEEMLGLAYIETKVAEIDADFSHWRPEIK